MKVNVWLTAISLLCFLSGLSLAQEKRAITLKDGSRLIGEIVSFERGTYAVKTSLGQLTVQDTDIVNISSLSSGESSGSSQGLAQPLSTGRSMDSQISSLQEQLMKDPHFMASVQELGKNPEVLQLLSQPDVVQAIMSRDVKAIENNPKMQELLDNPRMKALMQSIEQRFHQNP